MIDLWIWSIVYFALGFFNILFAWLGMIDFLLPVILAVFGGNKFFCNHLCGRGQLYCKLGWDLNCSRNKPTPRWMASKWFRYGFVIFFSCHVRKHRLSDLPCGKRGGKSARSNQAVLDVPRSVGMDLCSKYISRLGGAVQLWILQSDAYIPFNWSYRHDFL